MENTSNKISNIFEEALTKIDLLKANTQNFDVHTQLELSSSIRDHIMNSNEVKQGCEQENSLALRRGKILDEIQKYQQAIIPQTKVVFPVEPTPNGEFEYSEAKKSLIRLTNEELDENSEWKKNASNVVSMIESFDDYNRLLEDVRTKCQGDEYNIVLVGEYQSGKTTTFNTLCGGRNIGPIGTGVKTSATPLSLSYSENEFAQIIWKSEEELYNIFSELKGYIRKETFESFNINNNNSRLQLLNEIEELRKHHLFKDRIKKGDVDFFILCSLIISYWNSEDLRRFKEQTSLSLGEVGTFTKFPKDMKKRWWKNGYKAFTFEESVFVYIKQICCNCKSSLLKRINGRIIDCPGLFATKYDTYITEQAMKDADAIWYIYPRERQAGEQSTDFLMKFKDRYSDYSHKLYATNNLSLWNTRNSRSIYKENLADVRAKFGEDKQLIGYDAYLARLGYLKMSYDDGLLDDVTIKDFINDCLEPEQADSDSERGQDSFDFFEKMSKLMNSSKHKFETFDDAWEWCIRTYSMGQKFSSQDAVKFSNIEKVLESLRNFIERNKAYSIILSEGVNKLQNHLISLGENLYDHFVEPYVDGREKLTSKWDRRISLADCFEKNAANIVHATLFEAKEGKDSLAKRMSDSVYEKLFTEDVYNSMSESICNKIYSEVDQIKKKRKNKAELEKFLKELVTKCISEIIFDRISYWNGLLSSNQDKDFENMFLRDINAMEYSISSEWNSIYNDEEDKTFDMKKYYKISKDTKSLKIHGEEQQSSITINNKRINTVIALNYASVATAVTGMVGGYALYLVACVATGPIGWLIGGLTTVIGGFWCAGNIEEYNEKKFKKKMLPDLKKQLNESDLKRSIRNMIFNEIVNLFTAYEQHTKTDKDLIKKDRDLAVSRLDDPEIEEKCFRAVSAIARISEKNNKYNNFKKNLK